MLSACLFSDVCILLLLHFAFVAFCLPLSSLWFRVSGFRVPAALGFRTLIMVVAFRGLLSDALASAVFVSHLLLFLFLILVLV